MWDAADILTTRHIEVWHDDRSRFLTCDVPVFLPLRRNVRPALNDATHIVWPISPQRTIALVNEPSGEKATLVAAKGKHVGIVNHGVEQCRERMIFASEEQKDRLPSGEKFRRRTQIRLRCSDHNPRGDRIPPPGCCFELGYCFSDVPDIVLCAQGLHRPAPEVLRHI